MNMLTEKQKQTLDSAYEYAKLMKEEAWCDHMFEVAKRINKDNYLELFGQWYEISSGQHLAFLETEEIIKKMVNNI